MSNHNKIRMFQSRATDAKLAVQEFHAALAQQDTALVIFFCSSEYDLDALAAGMQRLFAGVQSSAAPLLGKSGLPVIAGIACLVSVFLKPVASLSAGCWIN